MSTVPALTAVTNPPEFTVAMFGLDDVHVACEVTFCVVLLERFAVAVNCALAPILGAVPVTVMELTVGVVDVGAVDVDDVELELPPLQAHAKIARRTATPDAIAIRRIDTPPWSRTRFVVEGAILLKSTPACNRNA